MILKLTPKTIVTLSMIGLVLIAAFFIFKYFQVSQELTILKSDPTQLTILLKAENQKTIEKLGKLMQLPEETPQIVIIDANFIASQPLLSKAEPGDAFIVYTNSKKAIIYRPSQNKIIDVIPVSGPTPAPPQPSTPAPPITSTPAPRSTPIPQN